MFGFAKKIKCEVPQDIKRGDIFSVDNKRLYEESPRVPAIFIKEPSDTEWIYVNKVMIISNNTANKHSSSVKILFVTKSLVGDITSISDIRTIKKTYLKEKIGTVSNNTLSKLEDCFMNLDNKGIVIEYQE